MPVSMDVVQVGNQMTALTGRIKRLPEGELKEVIAERSKLQSHVASALALSDVRLSNTMSVLKTVDANVEPMQQAENAKKLRIT